MAQENIQFTLDELRHIILGLRMLTLGNVEDGAVDEIRAMIKSLPSSEDLEKNYNGPSMLQKLQNDIGGIMRLIETYSKRDGEYKARYKSRTGLPPRYKVMEWRQPMATNEKVIKEAGIRDMWNAGKEAYYYRTTLSKLVKAVEEFGKVGDTIQPILSKILNPEYKAKIQQVQQRAYEIQDMSANLARFMKGEEELSGSAAQPEQPVAQEPQAGQQVTFTDGAQYTIQKAENDWKNIKKDELFISVKGVPYKLNINPTTKAVDGFEAPTEVQSREKAQTIWKEHGIDFNAEIDPTLQAIDKLDVSKLNVESLDKLYNTIEKLQKTPFAYSSSKSIIKIAQVVPDVKKEWEKMGFTNYDIEVLPVLKNIWYGNLQQVDTNKFKNIIDKLKQYVEKAKSPTPTPSVLDATGKPLDPNQKYKTKGGAEEFDIKKINPDGSVEIQSPTRPSAIVVKSTDLTPASMRSYPPPPTPTKANASFNLRKYNKSHK